MASYLSPVHTPAIWVASRLRRPEVFVSVSLVEEKSSGKRRSEQKPAASWLTERPSSQLATPLASQLAKPTQRHFSCPFVQLPSHKDTAHSPALANREQETAALELAAAAATSSSRCGCSRCRCSSSRCSSSRCRSSTEQLRMQQQQHMRHQPQQQQQQQQQPTCRVPLSSRSPRHLTKTLSSRDNRAMSKGSATAADIAAAAAATHAAGAGAAAGAADMELKADQFVQQQKARQKQLLRAEL
ncbi:hypothetical protein ACSSS7_005921 [Eimeria intestinalis]